MLVDKKVKEGINRIDKLKKDIKEREEARRYVGLNNKYDVKPGKRTPHGTNEGLDFITRRIWNSKATVEVKREMVYDFSAAKCFEMFKDYRRFLLSNLKDNERIASEALGTQFHAKPLQIGQGVGKGTRYTYAYFMDDVVYWMTDIITIFEEGEDVDADKNKVYKIGIKTQQANTVPKYPLKGMEQEIILTTFDKEPEKCHVTWIRKWLKPFVGIFSVSQKYEDIMCETIQRDMFSFRILLTTTYSKLLPKKDSKVLVIGAGPSGLHMTYELIQRGLDEKNVTILELDDRYGGKTRSVQCESNVQISNPIYNKPLPTGSNIFPCIKHVADKYYHFKATIETFLLSIYGVPDLINRQLVERNNTPDALHMQAPGEYYRQGEIIFHELGTCYLSPAYYAIRTLLKEIQSKLEEKAEGEQNHQGLFNDLASLDISREVAPDTYAIEGVNVDPSPQGLDQWVISTGAQNNKCLNFLNLDPIGDAMVVLGEVGIAKLHYCDLHEKYLGNYTYTVPPSPVVRLPTAERIDDTFEEITKPFGEFLKAHNLNVLEPLFTYALTAQGYGIISETPTFLAMQWLTPDCLDGYFEWYYYFLARYKDANGDIIREIPPELKKFDNPRKGMIVSGWGGLWDRIVALYDLESRMTKNAVITSIDRSQSKVAVEYHLKGDENNKKVLSGFDFLIVAAPLSDPCVDPTVPTLKLDFTPEEKNLFLTKDMEASKFKTNLFLPEANGKYAADHLRIFIDAILNPTPGGPDETGNGTVFGMRDSYKAVQPMLSTKGGNKYDPGVEAPREKMCYQYVSPKNIKEYGSDGVLEDKYKQFFKDHPDYLDGSNSMSFEEKFKQMHITSKAWTYYSHFNDKGINARKLWRIMDLQGKNNTIFAHASTNFESVLDIVNYNHMVLDGLSGRLDNFIHPESDTRPKPWQRPQKLLFNRSVVFNTLRYLLNMFVFVLWTVWYVVSYPFAEGIWLRRQRYNLQKAFQTPELPSPLSFTMKVFNDVGPTVRGYLDYKAGKSNGIPNPIPEDWDPRAIDPKFGPGDQVFKILMAPSTGFMKAFPDMPDHNQIFSSINWNLTDFRVGIRHWLTTFQDDFQPLLGPRVQSIIEWFSKRFPNSYSWVFSWIFATQFRCLIGYSYRFEDEKGGGLRIPDCHMLRQAIKDYGPDMGQRICLTVCKVFTEEVLRTKKMKIDFQPDFIEGSGTGCTVRLDNPVNHAFSNHITFEYRNDAEEDKFKNIDVSW